MKQRYGFVSNSSSSSFVLKKSLLTNEQLAGLSRPIEAILALTNSDDFGFIGDFGYVFHEETWDVTENPDGTVAYNTNMANLDLLVLAEKLGVPPEAFVDADLENVHPSQEYARRITRAVLENKGKHIPGEKYIAKSNCWFDKGTEAQLLENLVPEGIPGGIFLGVKNGKLDEEFCLFDEFEHLC